MMRDLIEADTTCKPIDDSAPPQETRWPRDIIIGNRHRKEYGDLAALARSINARGALIHPIAIDRHGNLIAGERRLRAWQHPECRFRDDPIPVTVIDIDSIIAGESDENDQALRKPFTPSEAVAIARALRPQAEAKAKERQRQHGGTAPGRKSNEQATGVVDNKHSAQIAHSDLPPANVGAASSAHSDKGRSIRQIARGTGKGARTLEKAEAIVAAAEADPDQFGRLVDDMDRTGRVHGPYKRLQNILAVAKIKAEPPPLPMHGPYRTGMIDPPWASEPDDVDKDHGARGYYPYPTMTPQQIAELPVPSILSPDASVWLWIPNFHLMHGHHLVIAKTWGLQPVALLTWIKRTYGQGQRVRGATEHLIQLVRGNVLCLGYDQKTWFDGEGGEHSQKPDDAYAIVEKLTPAPRYFELFARGQPRENWDQHGNEVGKRAAERSRRLQFLPPAATEIESSPARDDLLEIPSFLQRDHPDCIIGQSFTLNTPNTPPDDGERQ